MTDKICPIINGECIAYKCLAYRVNSNQYKSKKGDEPWHSERTTVFTCSYFDITLGYESEDLGECDPPEDRWKSIKKWWEFWK